MNSSYARTSESHPLIINTLAIANGELGLTFCPGKKQTHAMTGAWDRDIPRDIASVKSWGANTVISLLEYFEYEELHVSQLPDIFQDNFQWLNLPIRDKCAPDSAWLNRWLELRTTIKAQLQEGKKILIHCKGGFGRTGTVAAMILIDHGYSAQDAIASCRNSRRLSVETAEQEDFLANYARTQANR